MGEGSVIIEVGNIVINPSVMITMLNETGEPWELVIPSGTVLAHNVILINSHASGGAEFYADSTCIDGGGNTGWYFLSVPELLTEAATEVTMNSCVANGYIVTRAADDLAITRRGFCFVAGTTAPTVDDEVIFEDGNFYVGEYSLSLFGRLIQNTTYTMRSYIVSGGTVYYGNSVTVYTYPATPENLVLTPGEDSISINWDLIPGVYYYTIYWGNSAGITKDSNKMAGVYAPPFVHTSLSGAQTYYYRVTATFGGLESELSAEAYTTITALVTYPAFYPQNWLETEDYIKLLTSQYQLAENFKKWLRYNLGFYNDVMEAANQMNNDFDLDFAVGDQLDIIGDIVGQSRMLPFDPSDGSNPNLDDETYRTLLKAKIALNHWDGTLFSIEQKWVNIFPDTRILIVDNQDMTMNVSVLGNISELIQDLIEHDMIIPRPQGVMINYAWSPRSVIYFAYDIDNNEYSGYDKGRWSATFTEE